jgi:hypothetical protein
MAQPPALGNTNAGSLLDCTGNFAPQDFGRWQTRLHFMPGSGPAKAGVQALPISRPAAKTSAPPRTTWKIARLHGVSIQWF